MAFQTRAEAIETVTAPGQPHEIASGIIRGKACRYFLNAPPTLRELYSANRSDAEFLVYEDERLTFEDVWKRACTLAHVLTETLRVVPGDRVAISMRNYPEWAIAFIACTSVGAIAVALNAHWQSDEMQHALRGASPKVLFADQERIDRLEMFRDEFPELSAVAVRPRRPLPAGVKLWDDLLRRELLSEMPEVQLRPDDDICILYTSGSTGFPKGAVSSHRNIISALLWWEVEGKVNRITGAVSDREVSGGSRYSPGLLTVPFFHVTGLHSRLLTRFRSQSPLVLMYKWDVEKGVELIEREKITEFIAPAAITGDLVEYARSHGRDLSSLRMLGGGGSARAPEQVRSIDTELAHAFPQTAWSMTETNAIGTDNRGRDYLNNPESAGRGATVLDLRVVDEHGRDVGTNTRGELQVRGVSVFRGYWGLPEVTADSFDGDWFRTGDVAWIDAEGFVYIVDRIKDLVIRGGENIGCGEVEAALLEHPSILEASVYGVPDARLGEEVAATIFTKEDVSEDEIARFLRDRIAPFKVPRYYVCSREQLPRTPSGKILKRQLRSEALGKLNFEPIADQ